CRLYSECSGRALSSSLGGFPFFIISVLYSSSLLFKLCPPSRSRAVSTLHQDELDINFIV
ncbi:MAG: hypothetical protein QXL59_07720, partial [Candidatus Jordarchaeales archaeon]